MKMSHLPIKTPNVINSHLLCSHCEKLFSNPVINVHCGHTFCKECALSSVEGNHTKCPIDSIKCSTDSLVLNRALVSQIDEIKIYCKNGLKWSSDDNEYVIDDTGCQEVTSLGSRSIHEENCPYKLVSCPNGAELCGSLRQKDLHDHMLRCSNRHCPYEDKGCEFFSTASEVEIHSNICGYRSLQVVPGNVFQIKSLEKKNKLLEDQVKHLSNCVVTLESDKVYLTNKMEQCLRAINDLEDKYTGVCKEIEKLKILKRNNSTTDKKQRLSQVSRTPSQTSVASSYSSSLSSPKSESWTMPFQFKCIGTLRGHADIVWCLRTKGSMLYSCGDDQCIKIWDLEALEKGCKQTIKAHNDQVHTLAVGADYLYSGGGDGSLKAWNFSDRSLFKTVQDAHNNIIAAMVCTEDYLFTSSHTLIKVWNVSTLDHVHTIQGLHHWVRSLALSKTNEKLYSGSHNTIEIWDTISQFKLKGKITHKYGSVHSLAVTKTIIIAGTYNNNIHIFDARNHDYIQKLSGHLGIITSVVPSPSGKFLFTASADRTITIWNLENMLPIHTLSRHEGSVNTLVLYHDLLLSGSEDTEIKVFKYCKMQPGFVPT